MGSKLYKAEQQVLHFERDLKANPVAIGSVVLGELPTGFIIQSMRLKATGVTATTTLALGQDGGGSANGYAVAADPADDANVRCLGALLANAGIPTEVLVAEATDGILLTVAAANAVAGKVEVFVQGYQS